MYHKTRDDSFFSKKNEIALRGKLPHPCFVGCSLSGSWHWGKLGLCLVLTTSGIPKSSQIMLLCSSDPRDSFALFCSLEHCPHYQPFRACKRPRMVCLPHLFSLLPSHAHPRPYLTGIFFQTQPGRPASRLHPRFLFLRRVVTTLSFALVSRSGLVLTSAPLGAPLFLWLRPSITVLAGPRPCRAHKVLC